MIEEVEEKIEELWRQVQRPAVAEHLVPDAIGRERTEAVRRVTHRTRELYCRLSGSIEGGGRPTHSVRSCVPPDAPAHRPVLPVRIPSRALEVAQLSLGL